MTRRVLLFHAGEHRTWRDLDRHMGNVRVGLHDYALLEGRGGLPPWVRKPYRATNGARRVVGAARDAAVRRWLRGRLAPVGGQRTVVILTDQERLTPERAEGIASWMSVLEEHAIVLNHPTRTLRREALLQHFAATGRNTFRAWRASDPSCDPRFPVFVRGTTDHDGPLTDALASPAALQRALADLAANGRHLDALLVVEKVDVPRIHGATPKYSAIRIGDRVFPRHLFFADRWVAKSHGRLTSPEHLAAEWDFIQEFPHEDLVRDRFTAAKITYGRIDYAMVDGNLETFEINTNPSWMKPGYFTTASPRQRVHLAFLERMREAFDALP